MKKGFYTIMAAQFFSSLADNALLIAAIAMLVQLDGPPFLTPLLKFFFTISYVVLAFAVGAFPSGPELSSMLRDVGCRFIDTSVHTPPEAASSVIALLYVVAAIFNLAIPDTGARYPHQERNPVRLLVDFSNCFVLLWRDK